LKSNLVKFGQAIWLILTEVPGWPDAPQRLRVRRLIPLVIPVAAMALLFLWNVAWHQPRIQATRTAHQPLLALEQEVANLRLLVSDLQATELSEHAAKSARILLPEPSQLTPLLETLTAKAHARGWEATFHQMTGSATPPAPDAQIYFVSVRGKYVTAAVNTQSG